MRNKDENCTNCFYCTAQRASETSIQKVFICLESPPDTMLVNTPQGAVCIPAKRVVAEDVWCFRYKPLQPTEAIPEVVG